MIRRSALLAGLVAAVLTLSACTGATDTKPTAKPSAPNPDGEITIGLVLEPDNLDIRHTAGAPIEQILMDNVYQGLVTRTPSNEIIDALATSHEVSSDGLTYTFTLNDGITFHGGQPMTSADVVASFTQVKDDKTIAGHDAFADVDTITAPDEKSVVITLTQPNREFLFTLTTPAGVVLPKADKDTDMKVSANGTGPFKVASWKHGDSIEFTRNDEYWGQAAKLAKVTFVYIPNFASGVNAAKSGSLDVLTAVDPTLVPSFDGTDFTVTVGETTDKGVLGFNNERTPLNDKRVREAIRLAIDHEALVQATGSGDTLFGPIPPADPGYEDLSSVAPHDPARAKELLAEAGVSKLKLTLTIPAFYGTTIPQILVSDLNKVGITLTVESVEFSAWIQKVYSDKNYDLSFVLHVEPHDFPNFINPEYYLQYDNPETVKLYEQYLRETDEDKGEDYLKQAARIMSEDHAADWLYVGKTNTAVLPRVSGFPTDSVNYRINLAEITVTD